MTLRLCLAIVLLIVPAVQAAMPTVFKEGVHYTRLEQPLPKGVATVTEFFYYGCKTCFEMSPLLADWIKEKRVSFALVPAHSETAMAEEARMHHTAQVIGAMDKLYAVNYKMVQFAMELQGAERINHYLDLHDVNKELYWQAWSSPQVEQRLKGSAALTKQAQVFKTPTFVVHGVYKVDIEKMKNIEEVFELLDFLVLNKPSAVPALLQKRQ